VPIYDYVCFDCKHRVEVIHGINDTGPRFCPSCGHEGTMRKALGTPAIHFKGSGWAKKDRSSTSGTRTKSSASSTSGHGSGSDSGSGSGESAASSSSSESKAAADAGSGSGKASSGSDD
jgi:putative FmdB family regulatory protein